MSAAQKAIEVSAGERDNAAAVRTWTDEPGREAVASPALALQAAIATAYAAASAEPVPEPEVRSWPGWAKVGFLVIAAAGSWSLVIALVALFLGR